MGNEGGVVGNDKEVVFGQGRIGGSPGLPTKVEEFWESGG